MVIYFKNIVSRDVLWGMSVRKRKKADEDEPGGGEKKSEGEVDHLQPKSPPLSEKEPESDREQKRKAKCFSLRCLLTKFIIPTTLIVLFLWLVVPIAIEEYIIWRGYERAKDFGIPNDMMHLFSVFDGDSNGALDPYEFMFAVDELSRSKKVCSSTSTVFKPLDVLSSSSVTLLVCTPFCTRLLRQACSE